MELRIPMSESLKAKRRVIKHLTVGAHAKFNVAAAEVDHQDKWQRATIGYACISSTAFHAEKMLREIERFVRNDERVEVLDNFIDVTPWEG